MTSRNISGPTSPTTLSLPSSAALIPNSGEDTNIPTTTTAATAAEDSEKEDPDPTREPKRRRYCPKALEKIEELLIAPNSNLNCSFSFDTKFPVCSPEITPKFGSFNFVVSNSDKSQSCKGEEETTKNRTGSSAEAVQESKQD